ncbi:hypothetical protein [Hymenobacter terricola]|uniref:hypothetical protein n=1 Tax=Hymenobacter terricola TaxID=2819236 RepID=UPI001B30BD93|nr:hypothetical protein [Hymenobacter terricola]
MLHPNNQLMKCGTLGHDVPQRDRKVLSPVGFADFSFDFPGFCPATVSAFETVFLCAVGLDFFSSTF